MPEYRSSRTEITGYILVIAGMFAGATFVMSDFSFGDVPVVVPMAGIAVVLAAAAIVDTRSVRILGPQFIAFESPLRAFSWSIPISEVIQADLVRGRPHNRLRVIAQSGTRSLPLTWELWRKLRSA